MENNIRKIQVLGMGCAKCKKLYELTRQAASELALDTEVEYVTDIQQIISLGVMSSPALAINETLVLAGFLPGIERIKEEIKKWL